MPIQLRRKQPAAALLLCLPILPFTAQAETTRDDQQLDELVVMGSRIAIAPRELAAAPVLLDSHDIQTSQAAFATELLRTLPGTSTSRSGGPGALTQVRLRGAEADHIQVRVDGVKANDPATGAAYDFAHLRAPTLERIELLPGPAGVFWGSDALAGALHFATPRMDGVELRAAAGSRETREATLIAGFDEQAAYLTALADHYRTDGENLSEGPGAADGHKITTLGARGGVVLAPDLELHASVRRFESNVEFDPAPAPDFLPADGDRDSDIERLLAGVHLDWTQSDALQHRLALEYLKSSHEDYAEGTLTDIRRGRRYRGSWQSAFTPDSDLPGEQTWVLAMDTEHERFVQRGEATAFGDPNQRQTMRQHGGLIEWRYAPTDQVHFQAAVRRDWNQDFANATTWRTGLRADLPADLGNAWVSYATATKNPAFTERFGYTPDTFVGNPDLKPERSRSLEIGWLRDFIEQAATLEIVWHRTRLVEEIDGFFFDPNIGLATARNRDSNSRRQGVETSLTLRPTDTTRITGRYAWLNATEPDRTGGQQVRELRRPKHNASLSLLQGFMNGRGNLRADVIWNGKRHDQFFGTFPATTVTLDDYTLVNLGAGWQVTPELELFGRIENLTNADYEDVLGYNTPGRQAFAGFRLSL